MPKGPAPALVGGEDKRQCSPSGNDADGRRRSREDDGLSPDPARFPAGRLSGAQCDAEANAGSPGGDVCLRRSLRDRRSLGRAQDAYVTLWYRAQTLVVAADL